MITATCHPEVIAAVEAAVDIQQQANANAATAADRANNLATELYQWYVNVTDPLPEQRRRLTAIDLTPATALNAAHAGARQFESGWTVVERSGLFACRAIHRDGYERWLQPGQFRTNGPATELAVGDSIRVERAWTWVEPDTGFWLTRNGPWTPPGADELARLYINSTPRQTLDVIHNVTGQLLRSGTSFVMKTSAVPQPTGRADALILYMGMPDWELHRNEIVDIAAARPAPHRPAVPRFAETLAPGVAWGAGRIDGESFGKLRCDTIAAAVNEHPGADLDALVDIVTDALLDARVDPAAPHRHTGRH